MEQQFDKLHVLLPVVHLVEADFHKTIKNITVAMKEGADGIFLIGHSMLPEFVIEHYEKVREKWPDLWIGINFLRSSNEEAIEWISKTEAQALWLDDAGFRDDNKDSCEDVKDIRFWQKQYQCESVMIFGGVAFKYQEQPKSPAGAAILTAQYVDVVTTSGIGTGEAAQKEKIEFMKLALGTNPLGLASGITPENVQEYLPYVKYFLVSTGISFPKGDDFDITRIRALVKNMQT